MNDEELWERLLDAARELDTSSIEAVVERLLPKFETCSASNPAQYAVSEFLRALLEARDEDYDDDDGEE